MYKVTPAVIRVRPREFKDVIVQGLSIFDMTLAPVDPVTGLYTINDEVIADDPTLTFQSIVTLSSTPVMMTLHVVSDLNPNPQDGDVYTGTQWINVGDGIGGTF